MIFVTQKQVLEFYITAIEHKTLNGHQTLSHHFSNVTNNAYCLGNATNQPYVQNIEETRLFTIAAKPKAGISTYQNWWGILVVPINHSPPVLIQYHLNLLAEGLDSAPHQGISDSSKQNAFTRTSLNSFQRMMVRVCLTLDISGGLFEEHPYRVMEILCPIFCSSKSVPYWVPNLEGQDYP